MHGDVWRLSGECLPGGHTPLTNCRSLWRRPWALPIGEWWVGTHGHPHALPDRSHTIPTKCRDRLMRISCRYIRTPDRPTVGTIRYSFVTSLIHAHTTYEQSPPPLLRLPGTHQNFIPRDFRAFLMSAERTGSHTPRSPDHPTSCCI